MTQIQAKIKKVNMPGKYIERNECLIQYGQTEIYDFYKKKIRPLGKDSIFNIPMGVYSGIQGDFNKEWMQELIIGKGIIFRMPYRLGDIVCKKFKQKLKLDKDGNIITRRLPVDWYKSKQKWYEMWPGKTLKELKSIPNKPVVYCLNEHSDGYRYTIKWDTVNRGGVKNSKVYNFVPNRANHRYLAKVAKNPTGGVDYYESKPLRRRWRAKPSNNNSV